MKNENLGNFIKNWKGNFINKRSKCFKDSFTQSLVHSIAEALVKKEEELRRKKGLPTSKNFQDYANNSPEDSLWRELLETFDIIKKKIENNDTTPVKNTYDSKNNPKDKNIKLVNNIILIIYQNYQIYLLVLNHLVGMEEIII